MMAGREMSVQKVPLHCPSLEEIAKVLQDGMGKNFSDVQVAVVDCPDLTQKPFMLADKGICGSPRIADIGGVPYLMPLAQRDKIFDLAEIAKLCELPEALVIGAGAGPAHVIGHNTEMITNVKLGESCSNNTHIVEVKADGGFEMKQLNTTECNLLMNVLLSEGKQGKVLEIRTGSRTGKLNFYTCVRKVLQEHYGEKCVGLGGTFLQRTGKAKVHVMPNFSEVPLRTDEEVDEWLNFYEVPAEVVSVGVLESHDPDLDLRVEHFHCFSDHGDGGHYHYDTTPATASYLAYFSVAEFLYRIDRPQVTHNIGRDLTVW